MFRILNIGRETTNHKRGVRRHADRLNRGAEGAPTFDEARRDYQATIIARNRAFLP